MAVSNVVVHGLGLSSNTVALFLLKGLGIGAAVIIDTTAIDIGTSRLDRLEALSSVVDRTVAVGSRLDRTITGTSILGEE